MSNTIKDVIYIYFFLYLLNKSIYLKNYYFTYTCRYCKISHQNKYMIKYVKKMTNVIRKWLVDPGLFVYSLFRGERWSWSVGGGSGVWRGKTAGRCLQNWNRHDRVALEHDVITQTHFHTSSSVSFTWCQIGPLLSNERNSSIVVVVVVAVRYQLLIVDVK